MMSLFGKKKNANDILSDGVINTATLDLRKYTPQALSVIKRINAATILLSENPPEGFMEAYALIQKNIACEITLPDKDNAVILNGTNIFSCRGKKAENIYILSGISVITDCVSEQPIKIFSNGALLYEKDNNIDFIQINGDSAVVDFHIEHTVSFPVNVELDADFFEEIGNNTVIIAGNTITLKSNISREIIKNKNLFFVAGADIACPKEIISTVQTMSLVGREIRKK